MRLVLIVFLSIAQLLRGIEHNNNTPCTFTFSCTDNPLCQIYPNQNMCELLDQIPRQLRELPFVINPTHREYNNVRFSYNKRFNIFPHAIIIPHDVEEAVQAFEILKKCKLHFAIRSGGHCYGPGSLSPDYVIDLRKFNYVKPNIKKGEVRIGAGTHLGGVIGDLGKIGYAIPTGTCPSVGVTGLALGGGIGFLLRQYGLTSDSIKNICMIDAHGDIINVTQENNPDLFWAMCGAGGGSFGIVLEFTFKMHYVPKVQLLTLSWDWDPEIIPDIMNAWQKWIVTLPDDISTEFDFKYQNFKSSFFIIALKTGKEKFCEWEKAFKNFHPQVSLQDISYLEAATQLGSVYTMPFSKAKSKILFEPLPKQGINVVVEFFQHIQDAKKKYLVLADFGAGGGKLLDGDSSFFPRKMFSYFFLFGYWDFQCQDHDVLRELNEFYEDLAFYTSPYSYSNLVDFDLGPTYLNAYYGDHVDRLICIKRKVDPKNLFRWRQSIPLEKPKV